MHARPLFRTTVRFLLLFGALQWSAASLFAQARSVTILHTNDMHAAFLPREATWVKQTPRPLVGGFPVLQYLIDSIRNVDPPVLVLDAGDVMTGNPITEEMYRGAEGGALFAMMNMMGYDAWSPGNHDFDISQKNFVALTRIAQFPTVCANMVDSAGKYQFGQRPFVVIERGGLKIGVIGLMSQYLYNLVNQNNLAGIRILSPGQTLKKIAAELKPRTDLLIALTHEGFDGDSLLAMEAPVVDLIVGGHSHTRLRSARRVNGVLIVQAGSNAENLGYLKVKVEQGRVVSYDSKLIQTWERPGIPKTPLAAMADSVQAGIDLRYSVVIGELTGDWIRNDHDQSAIGTFIADAQRRAVHADIGFMNSQGIRSNLMAGPITKRDLFEVLPFRNVLTTFQLRGWQVRDVLKYMVEKRSSIQIAGLNATWNRGTDKTVTFTSVEVGGAPLEDDRWYICTASDYFLGEAPRYIGTEIRDARFLQTTLFSAVEQAVREQSPISPEVLYTIRKSD